ncbi:hypothetical protein Vi05172_g11506 [Venturia inaequalis]|nr:hypothetical protein Vi05172_g11506 [Venturia inaequalis]
MNTEATRNMNRMIIVIEVDVGRTGNPEDRKL